MKSHGWWATLVVFLLCNVATADGLIFQLPADGASARFAVETKMTSSVGELKQEMASKGTLTVSSVGKVHQNQQHYRWIELLAESQSEGAYPQLVLKMLIPEKRLVRGQDPLAHAALTFFDPKPVDEEVAPSVNSFIDEGFNRIQYEIDRFRVDFPRSLFNAKSLESKTIETPAGKFTNCETLAGMSSYDGPLLGNGRSVYRTRYTIAIHPDAPFGVVSLESEFEGREISEDSVTMTQGKRMLILTAIGKDAKSTLDKPEPKLE